MATLPQDVFDCAIDDLRNDRRALGTCALVCRDWLHRSRVHLFSEVTFQYSIRDVTSPSLSHTAVVDRPTGQLVDHPATVSPGSSTVPRSPNRAAEFTSLIGRNPKLADYVQAVTVSAVKKRDGAQARWTLLVAGHLQLLRLPQLRSLRLVRFAFESFADLIPTIQALPSLDSLICEEAQFLPQSFAFVEHADTALSPDSEALDLRPERATSLKTLSLSIASNLTAAVEQPDTNAAVRALRSAEFFMRSGLLRMLTSLEILDASTVLGWLPILEGLGPRLHHVGIALHDVPVSDDEVLPGDFNVSPSPRNTIVRVFEVLRRCTSLRTLSMCYDAEDTMTVRTGLTIGGGGGYLGLSTTVEDGPLISPYFFDEAVRLFSGASGLRGRSPAPPFPALQVLHLRLVTTVHSLQTCASACAALAKLLACHEYPAFGRLGVVVEEPAILGVLFGDREADEAACVRKERALRAGLLRPFEEAGIALEVAVLQRLEEY